MPNPPLQISYSNEYPVEIGIDEAGRGPMFGRLYVAAVVLPKEQSQFAHHMMKDSKKFHSETKIQEVAEYIKQHSIAWSVNYIEADMIDHINIRQSVFRGMHDCCKNIIDRGISVFPGCNHTMYYDHTNTLLLVDGNDFMPYRRFDEETEQLVEFPFVTIEGGDNKYTAIAAASILAKVARDNYIKSICESYPVLNERYGLLKNKGYGTKLHMDAIREYGISEWHRRSFGLCGKVALNPVSDSSDTRYYTPN